MTLHDLHQELHRLLRDIKDRTSANRTDYTKGYVDALLYVIEWLEEEDDD